MNILVIAAHPDDEVLGMGATIRKLSRNNKVHLCVVSEGVSAQYTDKNMIKTRQENCIKAGKTIGISDFKFLDFPDQQLLEIPHMEINNELEKIFKKWKPKIVYTTPYHDLNSDHKRVFVSTLVAARPLSNTVKELLCYELPGFVKTPFEPTVYVDIRNEFLFKIKAFKLYKSEIMKFPHPRSIKAIENLAIQRGIESGLIKAESFHLIKKILTN